MNDYGKKMIISASRRTDIPAFHSGFFLEKVKEGAISVRNPMNHSQIRRVSLMPDDVECIVFWSKNPQPLLDRLDELNHFTYYFQFSLNPYDNDIEMRLPNKKTLIETFKKLSDLVNPKRIIWRYDPVLINNKYTVSYHIDMFSSMSRELRNYTNKVIFSFLDFYKKTEKRMIENNVREITEEERHYLAKNFSEAALENKLEISTCAEIIDLSVYGIKKAACIDGSLIGDLIGQLRGNLQPYKKDKNQRAECLCTVSVDIGEYNTCNNGCIYCYAGNSHNSI